MSASGLFRVFEILVQIFEHVSVSDPAKGPIYVSQVSQFWRGVALKSPSIWSNVTVRLDTGTTGSAQRHTSSLALLHFERSQEAPISLTVDATRRFKSEEKMELLQPNADRICSESLKIKASEGSLADLLWLDIMDMKMPRLEDFSTIVENTLRIGISRKTNTINKNMKIIPPVSVIGTNRDLVVIRWAMWNPVGLTILSLDTTHIQDIPDMDDIYFALATTCQTLQQLTYQGYICSINYEANTRPGTRLAFPNLHSLTVLCHENMVPLLTIMTIPALDSLVLRDFKVSPATPAIHATLMDSDQRADLYDLYQAIKPWTSISRLEIYGVQVDDLPQASNESSDLLNYLGSLDNLSSLAIYGSHGGIATLIADALFKTEKPRILLPKLSRLLLGVTEMSSNDHLFHFLLARQLNELPRLKKLSINEGYFRHLRVIDLNFELGLSNLDYMDVLLDSSDDIFIFPDPEANKFIPIEEENLLERLPDLLV